MNINNSFKFVSRVLVISLLLAGLYVYMPREEPLVVLAEPLETITLEVAPGDSLWSLALDLSSEDPRATVHLIKTINGLKDDLIYPGQLLEVPGNKSLQVYNN